MVSDTTPPEKGLHLFFNGLWGASQFHRPILWPPLTEAELHINRCIIFCNSTGQSSAGQSEGEVGQCSKSWGKEEVPKRAVKGCKRECWTTTFVFWAFVDPCGTMDHIGSHSFRCLGRRSTDTKPVKLQRRRSLGATVVVCCGKLSPGDHARYRLEVFRS